MHSDGEGYGFAAAMQAQRDAGEALKAERANAERITMLERRQNLLEAIVGAKDQIDGAIAATEAKKAAEEARLRIHPSLWKDMDGIPEDWKESGPPPGWEAVRIDNELVFRKVGSA